MLTNWLPLRVVVGKRAEEGIVEIKQRLNGESEEIHVNDLENFYLYDNLK